MSWHNGCHISSTFVLKQSILWPIELLCEHGALYCISVVIVGSLYHIHSFFVTYELGHMTIHSTDDTISLRGRTRGGGGGAGGGESISMMYIKDSLPVFEHCFHSELGILESAQLRNIICNSFSAMNRTIHFLSPFYLRPFTIFPPFLSPSLTTFSSSLSIFLCISLSLLHFTIFPFPLAHPSVPRTPFLWSVLNNTWADTAQHELHHASGPDVSEEKLWDMNSENSCYIHTSMRRLLLFNSFAPTHYICTLNTWKNMYDGCYAMQLLCSVFMWSWVWWTVPHECVKLVPDLHSLLLLEVMSAPNKVFTDRKTDKVDINTFSTTHIVP